MCLLQGIGMSKNHQFIEFDQQVVERWIKTVSHMVSGKRLNPYKPSESIDFVLRTNPTNFDFTKLNKKDFPDSSSKVTLVYEDEVLELYSDNEARLFRRFNKTLIERGLIRLYDGEASGVDTTNSMSDADLEAIANLSPITAYKKQLYGISSPVTVGRLIAVLARLDKSASYIKAAEEHLLTLNK
jgi:hypothetical protein